MTTNTKYSSFQAFYAAELQPELAKLERVRKRRLLVYIAAAVIFLPFFLTVLRYPPFFPFVAMVGAALFGVAKLIDFAFFDAHKLWIAMQRDVAARLVNHIQPGMDHYPNEYIGAADFLDCNLFSKLFTRYQGRNRFFTAGAGFNLSFSWLKVQYQASQTRRGKRIKSNKTRTVFMGWFFVVNFKNTFTGETMALPDFAEARLGWLGRELQEVSTPPGMELLLLENAAFEKCFKVLSTSQDDARHILTPMVMEEAAKLASRLKSGMYLSFTGNRMFAVVPVANDFFDNMLVHSLNDPRPLQELYHAVRGINRLAATVARYTKVWQ